jgi:hypothetical protein
MFSGIRKRLSYTNVVLTLALVFAMSGGALAASRYVITSTKQIKPSVLKQLQGKKGANGAQGPAGSAGAQGTAGAAGAKGEPGKGEPGIQGVQGKEGKEGKEGKTGFTTTLPEKETETGAWAFGPTAKTPYTLVAISFAIPLAAELPATNVHFINETTGKQKEEPGEKEPVSSACMGTAHEPRAAPGNLCVYAFSLSPERIEVGGNEVSLFEEWYNPGESKQPGVSDEGGASTAGAAMVFRGAENAVGNGTWAVTAPAGP